MASVGGIDAVTSVIETLPADFPGCVLVVIHQVPDRVSRLADIFQQRTALRVGVAETGARLAAGDVHVAPAGRHLLVAPERELALIRSGPFPPNRPSADLLLTSMALSLREQAVAVVLSGGGHDGSTGAAAIHQFGGRVLAADRATSLDHSMPQAAIEWDQTVDAVLPVGQIGPHLAATL